jgi:hypothetical protein
VTKEARQHNEAIALLSNVFNVLTERADTRSWLTLPKHIYIARLDVEPGVYDLKVEFLSDYGAVVDTKEYPDIRIGKKQTRYITFHRVPKSAIG